MHRRGGCKVGVPDVLTSGPQCFPFTLHLNGSFTALALTRPAPGLAKCLGRGGEPPRLGTPRSFVSATCCQPPPWVLPAHLLSLASVLTQSDPRSLSSHFLPMATPPHHKHPTLCVAWKGTHCKAGMVKGRDRGKELSLPV